MSLALRIKEAAEVRGDFILRSGTRSNLYFDKYRFEADPILLSDVTRAMVGLIPREAQVLCGLEMGGIPIVTMLSHHSQIPAAFIRKTRKEYGTCNYVEGTDLVGKRIVLVEDVVSSGGAVIDAAIMLRSDSIAVDTAICVLDRQTGGPANLREAGIQLISLLQAHEIDEASNKQ